MTKVIVNKHDRVVVYVGDIVNMSPEGIDVGNMVLGNPSSLEVYTLEVSETVRADKFCYTPQDGFYQNPNYTEPVVPPIPPTLEEIQTQILLNTEYLVVMSELTNI